MKNFIIILLIHIFFFTQAYSQEIDSTTDVISQMGQQGKDSPESVDTNQEGNDFSIFIGVGHDVSYLSVSENGESERANSIDLGPTETPSQNTYGRIVLGAGSGISLFGESRFGYQTVIQISQYQFKYNYKKGNGDPIVLEEKVKADLIGGGVQFFYSFDFGPNNYLNIGWGGFLGYLNVKGKGYRLNRETNTYNEEDISGTGFGLGNAPGFSWRYGQFRYAWQAAKYAGKLSNGKVTALGTAGGSFQFLYSF